MHGGLNKCKNLVSFSNSGHTRSNYETKILFSYQAAAVWGLVMLSKSIQAGHIITLAKQQQLTFINGSIKLNVTPHEFAKFTVYAHSYVL